MGEICPQTNKSYPPLIKQKSISTLPHIMIILRLTPPPAPPIDSLIPSLLVGFLPPVQTSLQMTLRRMYVWTFRQTGLKLLTGQVQASLLCLLKSPFGEVTIKYVCIVVERHSLVNLQRISTQEDSYQYGGTHFYLASQILTRHMHHKYAQKAMTRHLISMQDQAMTTHLLRQ